MYAIICEQFGSPEKLKFKKTSLSPLKDFEVMIDTHSAGVNFPDVLIIQNKYQFTPKLPFIPGNELSGVVIAIGTKVSKFNLGDRVFAYVPHGAFAENVILSEDSLILMRRNMDFDSAAALTLAFGTSYHSLVHRAQLKKNESLLVLGAAGGVGLAAIQIGKELGARVIAAASTNEKLELCSEHGADELINYNKDNLRNTLKEKYKEGIDVIFDPVGGSLTELAFRSISWKGRFLVIGFANGEIPKLPLNLPLLKGASVVGVFWGEFIKRQPMIHLQAMEQLMNWYEHGKIKPFISKKYELKETPKALLNMSSRNATGKIIIKIKS